MTDEIWLALDIGTTGTKAALIDEDGHTLASATRSYDTITADGGVVEQQAANWWWAAIDAVNSLDATARDAISAIAVTGQMQDVILSDPDGEPVRRVILYSDTRARTEADEVNAMIGADQLRELTGNEQDASGILAKLLWLNRHEPESLEDAKHLFVGAADYVVFNLTGNPVSDTTTASTTGLFDITARTWLDNSVFTALGLEGVLRLLPDVRSGGTQAGLLTESAANLFGLRAGIPVYHGPGDAGATTLGAGSGEPGKAYLYIGTSGWVAFTSTQRVIHDAGIITLAHPRTDQYIIIAPLLTAGGNLDWARDVFDAEGQGISHDDFINGALKRDPTELIYLPYLNGERSPFRDPFARGAFIGLRASHTRSDLCRAVLEGVVYAYRHALDTLLAEPLASLTLTGGGSRSAAWSQLFADVTGVPVIVADDAENVGARGAVMAARGTFGGNFPAAMTLQPDATHRALHEAKFGRFKAAYLALKPIFADMG